MVALPAATPATFTPCSTPHIHVGRDPVNAIVSSLRPSTSRYVVRVIVSFRGGNRSTSWTSPGGLSEFFANSVKPSAVAGYDATRQSHIGFDSTDQTDPFRLYCQQLYGQAPGVDRAAHALGQRVVLAVPDLQA